MSKAKQIGMAVGTFSVALGIGFVMQNGDVVASRFGAESAQDQPAPFIAAPTEEVAAAAEYVPAPVVASVVTLPKPAPAPIQQDAPVQLAALDPEIAPELESDAIVADQMDCVPTMTATAAKAAMVDLLVAAPCNTGQAVTIHHQGMMFNAKTDTSGNVDLTVPALSELAVMIAAFEDGNGAVSTIAVPDFASYDRAVLQWQGDTSVMLSAYEGDAEYGDPSHIHIGNPGDMTRIQEAQGGYLMRLGDDAIDDALMAEVYTFPSGMMDTASDVLLVAEAEITAGNCGRELVAQSIQINPNGQTSALDLTMIMPDCDAVGDFLILQNMFKDLTIASR